MASREAPPGHSRLWRDPIVRYRLQRPSQTPSFISGPVWALHFICVFSATKHANHEKTMNLSAPHCALGLGRDRGHDGR